MQITNCRSERVCKFFSVSWWGIFFLCVHRGAFCDLLFLLCLREFHVCNIAFSATWGGAKLSDVLKLVGLTQCTIVTPLGGRHVEFTSVDNCKVSGSHMAYDEIWCFSFILILSVVLSDACFMIGCFSSRSIHLIFFSFCLFRSKNRRKKVVLTRPRFPWFKPQILKLMFYLHMKWMARYYWLSFSNAFCFVSGNFHNACIFFQGLSAVIMLSYLTFLVSFRLELMTGSLLFGILVFSL